MLHVEQMVGSGFSQGPVTVTNDDELAVMFIGFMQQFLLLFPEMNGFSLYMTGESYAGYHASYISKNIVQQPAALNLTFRGLMLFDPSLHYDIIQEQAPALPFARYWQDIMRLNDTTLATLQTQSDRCGYTNFFDQLTYPPSKALTFPNGRTTATEDCDIFSAIINAALVINPAFNIYDILDISVLSDPLGLPGTFPSQQFPFSAYFNIEAVKQVLHAPNITWETCASGKVYATPSGYGTNAPSTFEALPIVLNAGKRVIIGHGALDYVLMQNGTRFAIQNMTWQNRQGFQQPIGSGLFYTGAQGSVGNVHEERGLTYVEPYLSGHMVPQFQPLVAVKMLTYLLGQIDTIVGK
ncbi:uncharacterized protein L969DRAFT_86500 [Mixia osmundae IAM 14324]|uniref:uncharacterized protein n=1 Tax=Mixia osmundae (strain CBS 9802 / IAM 14324 / JCM 22182 / KY 12970) TaxID=764103 RepID=UPI0004A55016|nr:uncharacterized protein L969DRAFT_86500 [Mixia osmundae IAM 14324]KEI39904.1 hypothetical protein L969DRAFT_86500 [Mixia osmundae IAM 14324]